MAIQRDVRYLLAFTPVLLAFTSCGSPGANIPGANGPPVVAIRKQPVPVARIDLNASLKPLQPGVAIHKTRLGDNPLWVYLPQPLPKSVPCIFIAPAGSRMFHGMGIVTDDMPEHLPYVKAGYAVICYGVSGPYDARDTSLMNAYKSAKAFMNARGGIDDGKRAINWALQNIPGLDANRLITVGHSSAGTLALQLAEHDSRIQACISFMPVPDTEAYMRESRLQSQLELGVPGYSRFTHETNPYAKTASLQCPTLLFCSQDDPHYPGFQRLASKLKRTNKSVTLKTVRSGGHYQPMVEQGIPAAIRWLDALGFAQPNAPRRPQPVPLAG